MGYIQQWKERSLARRYLSTIHGKDIAAVVRDMESEGKGPNTIRLHLAILPHLFTVAISEWSMTSPIPRPIRP